jgi:hypothetical protein
MRGDKAGSLLGCFRQIQGAESALADLEQTVSNRNIAVIRNPLLQRDIFVAQI